MRDSMDRRKGKKIRACEEEAKRLLTDLPTGVVIEILSWLPLKSVFNCRCVCKTWLQIISDPHFAKLHLSRSAISILIHGRDPLVERRYLRLYQIVKALDSGFIRIEEMVFGPRLNLPEYSPMISLVNSCNGLVCLHEFYERDLLYVCNPVLGEFITIKVPEEDNRDGIAFCFGFSAKTNQYKVLQTFCVNGEEPKAEVYTIGTGSWRSLGNAPISIVDQGWCFDAYLHGAFHWVTYSDDGNSKDQIVCFDFEKDMFGEVPFFRFPCGRARVTTLKLGVIEDCLSVCGYPDHGSNHFEIWVMKDYGVKESWTMQFRIKHEGFHGYGAFCDWFYPLILLKNGRMLMSYGDDLVVCYNNKKKRSRATEIFCTVDGDSIGSFDTVAYTPCFISLKDVAKGEQISR
ncbi:hypothetical protein COLO4_13967 [Corchorus olitorius]|uniref:F-box domain-containing protein n=1 Tax=Corchorus olitorius TaxID=93759 RepID=A0A1R3JUA7_9ROSI|nr:hypothetical protein COLO4_13967 [Corchorus olitorius]